MSDTRLPRRAKKDITYAPRVGKNTPKRVRKRCQVQLADLTQSTFLHAYRWCTQLTRHVPPHDTSELKANLRKLFKDDKEKLRRMLDDVDDVVTATERLIDVIDFEFMAYRDGLVGPRNRLYEAIDN